MTISPRAQQLQRSLAMTLEHIKELDKTHPSDVDAIYALLVNHVRSARPHVLLAVGVP